jgi:tetratricopeptide (TPR) repeat protein
VRYTGGVRVAGRRRELDEIARLLDRALTGAGGALLICGPAGSGRTLLAQAAAERARDRGLQVLWARPAHGQPGRMAWAQLLRDTNAPAGLTGSLLETGTGALDLDAAARHLVSGKPRLIVVDDIDSGGPDATAMLAVVAARCAAAPIAVIATSSAPLGLKPELRLDGLSEADLAEALPGLDPDSVHALWLASRGRPGVALLLARELDGRGRPDHDDRPEHEDPVVRLALAVSSAEQFLEVDMNLVRLLEAAAPRARDGAARARVLARLARELLGDASAAARRRALADEALGLARRAGNAGVLADVLDARLHALWDPDGAADRLAAGSEIIDLARAAGDGKRERQGMFWRFMGLMELGRVAEAESALAAYAHEAAAAGDAEAAVLAASRQAMLAILRGRFEQAGKLAAEVRTEARRIGLPDAEAVSLTLEGLIALERGMDDGQWRHLPDMILAAARQRPGHLFEANAARVLLTLGRVDEAAAELQRVLPHALASSGPRWLSAMANLAVVAAAADDTEATARIYQALLPYRGRLVLWGGAAGTSSPVSHHLGSLAATLGRHADAAAHFEEAIAFAERTGALPFLAHSLAGLGDALARTGDTARAAACRDRARDIARRLGMTVLLRRLGRPASEWSLLRDGGDWILTAGGERTRLRDGRGLHYLRALLAAPGQGLRALDLAAGGAGLVPAQAGEVFDGTAREAYRRRLADVTAALDAADRSGDREAARRAEQERSALTRELRAAAGLGGKLRAAAPEAERARVNVTRTLRATIGRIAETAPLAAAHLAASVRTGGSCRYEPAAGGPDRWLV